MGINANITNEAGATNVANMDYQYNTYAEAEANLGIFQIGDIIFVNTTTGFWLLGTQKQAGTYLFNGTFLEYISQSLKDQILSTQTELATKEHTANKVTSIVGNETNSTLYASLVSILTYFSSTKIKELALTPMGFGEWWQPNALIGGTPTGNLSGAAISGGAQGSIGVEGVTSSYYPFGIATQCTTTINSGYRVNTPSITVTYFGKKSLVNEVVFMLPSAVLATRQVKGGFLNQVLNVSNVTNGCYWQIDGDVMSFKSAKVGGVSVVSATTYTLSRGVQYLARIEVNETGTEAILTLYNASSPTVAVHTNVINTLNALPNSTTTTFGDMVVATNTATSTSATFLIYLYMINRGTKQGLLKNG